MELDENLGRQGGDIRNLPKTNYIDCSTCVNRYGPPSAVVDAIHMIEGDDIRIHPYEAAGNLANAYAQHLGVSVEEIVPGRGTTEFIWSLSRTVPHESVLIPLPAYSDFLRAFRGRTRRSQEDVSACPSIDFLGACMSEANWVIISNPNNPIGAFFPRSELIELCRSYPRTTLVVDESYIDFLFDAGQSTLVGCDLENVAVLRSPSKFYGIAGGRAGILWTKNEGLRKQLLTQQDTWPISNIDTLVACTALQQADWAQTIRAQLRNDVLWLEQLLASLFEYLVVPAPVHYRFMFTPIATDIAAHLQLHNVLVRVFGAGHGINSGGLRITCPMEAEREHFAKAMRSYPELQLEH